jgi:aldehyde:ferredoxin oxidoreductase
MKPDDSQLLCNFQYPLLPVIRGYAGRTLYINLSTNSISSKPVSEEMRRCFTGGKGFCLWLLWNAIVPETEWNDLDNEIVFASGPISGITTYPGSGKVTAVTLSPLTHSVVDSNGGGYFGPYLKFAGWDALEIQGKAKEDVIIFLDGDNGNVTVETAGVDHKQPNLYDILTQRYALNESDKRNISVVFTGKAAEYVPICGLNISYFDTLRKQVHIKQCARGGTGRVFRDKKILAIVVRFSGLYGDSNGAVNISLLRKAGHRINREIKDFDAFQNDMRRVGTPYLVDVTNALDLLPVENYRFSRHDYHTKIEGEVWKGLFDHQHPDNCWYGCTLACAHHVPHFHLTTGPEAGQVVNVDGPEYETLGALGSNCGIFDPASILELNYYADAYGVDTISLGNSIAFAMECYENGILNRENTGGLELEWGKADMALELLHQMARGEGFGMIVGQGVQYMKKYFVSQFIADPQFLNDIGMEVKGLEISEYITKESPSQQAGYGMALKGAQHDEANMVFIDLVRKGFKTTGERAKGLIFFSLFRTWFSLVGLCRLPWNDITPDSNRYTKEPSKFPEHIENYTWLYQGITGEDVSIDDLLLQSERVYNFQKFFNLRMGFGTRKYDYPPYRAMGPVTCKEYESRAKFYDQQIIDILSIDPIILSTQEKIDRLRHYRENQYDQMVDEVYRQRGWSKNGIPTIELSRRLGIDFPEVVELIKKYDE